MKHEIPAIVLGAAGLSVLLACGNAKQIPTRPTPGKPALLANRWKVSPAGVTLDLPGDMPATILITPDGHHALVNTCGFHNHGLSLVDLDKHSVSTSIDLTQDWIGMARTSDGTIYVSGGGGTFPKLKKGAKSANLVDHSSVLALNLENATFVPKKGISLPSDDPTDTFTSGIATLKDGSLVVLDIQKDTVYKITTSGSILAKQSVGYRPYQVAVSPDGKTLAVSNWGDATVSLLDSESLNKKGLIPVGKHPNALLYSPKGDLFVANAGSDSVSVIDGTKVDETIRTTLLPSDPLGAAPIALAMSKNGARLYVANADNNDVAVVDTTKEDESRVIGFIPTGRYPSALALTPDDKTLLIGTAKGLFDRPNAPLSPLTSGSGDTREVLHTYVGDLLTGSIAEVALPDAKGLAHDTKLCLSNRPVDTVADLSASTKKSAMAALKKIKHVVYVIKENRTYDQVLGDVKEGNGDPDLIMFGQNVTPNIHKLVGEYTLFDNLFCDGEVSQVGHQWTDGAYAGDYTQKQWILSYSGRQEVDSDTRLNSSPGGFLWQDAQRHHKTTRIYGEYLQWQEDHTSAKGAVKEDPEKFGCSAAFEKVFAANGRDTEKVDVFLNEMHGYEKTGNWPNFMVMALPEDHTRGLSAGAFSPEAMVGSNDQAVGKLIEGISHSKFWKDTAVFVIEDDAQDGADHVDAHRTEGFVVSPYIKRHFVDHHQYSTSSMIKTIEVILDLPPMSQYDHAAMPMLASVTSTPDFSPYSVLPPQVDLMKRNPRNTALAKRSAALDFSDVDRADPDELNAILWEYLHPGTQVPAPVRGHLNR